MFIKAFLWKFGAVTFFITSHFLFDSVEYLLKKSIGTGGTWPECPKHGDLFLLLPVSTKPIFFRTTISKIRNTLPSIQRFFYQNSQNMTFYQFLCKILTNKSTRKKIQLVEGTKEINSNNFHHNWRSLRCLNKLKCVTQV